MLLLLMTLQIWICSGFLYKAPSQRVMAIGIFDWLLALKFKTEDLNTKLGMAFYFNPKIF